MMRGHIHFDCRVDPPIITGKAHIVMGKDVVEELKKCAEDHPTWDGIVSDLCMTAAAEIERLRALVNEQSHGETYGRRSGGGKEILFK